MRFNVHAWTLALCLSACGGRVDEELPAPGSPCVPTLGEKLVRHACVHITSGSFTSVAGSATDDAKASDVSKLHKAFDVTARAEPFYLKYRAARAGQHVLLTDEEVVWRVQDSEGKELVVRSEVVEPKAFDDWTTCTGAGHAAIMALELGQEYVFMGASAPERFTLFVEHAETFGSGAWVKSCP
jgi:hypothetical protein